MPRPVADPASGNPGDRAAQPNERRQPNAPSRSVVRSPRAQLTKDFDRCRLGRLLSGRVGFGARGALTSRMLRIAGMLVFQRTWANSGPEGRPLETRHPALEISAIVDMSSCARGFAWDSDPTRAGGA
eukprot:1242463-Pyramimonas_sp.AAC.1